MFGSVHDYRPLTVALGKVTRMRVLSINYRLAPEHLVFSRKPKRPLTRLVNGSRNFTREYMIAEELML
jgi:hypothetical protein